MPYVKRDTQGKIIALFAETQQDTERLEVDNPEILQFLKESKSTDVIKELLAATDIELARVLEDVINLLVEKNIILFTELPASAQQKLIHRQKARTLLQAEASILSEYNDTL